MKFIKSILFVLCPLLVFSQVQNGVTPIGGFGNAGSTVKGDFSTIITSPILNFQANNNFAYMDLTADIQFSAVGADVGEWYYLKIMSNNFNVTYTADFVEIEGEYLAENLNYLHIHVCAANEITVQIFSQAIPLVANWKDLRSGGDTFTDGNAAGNDIRYRTGMTMTRDAQGVSFSGANPWTSWVKFESLSWTRGENKAVQWILTQPTSTMMIGIGSTASDEANNAQYAQSEINAYFSNSTQLWGLYGNGGTLGAAVSQNFTTTLPAADAYKIIFTSDGDAGGDFRLYALPSAAVADWNDVSNLIVEEEINFSPSQTTLMPAIIPRSDTQKFIAVSVN